MPPLSKQIETGLCKEFLSQCPVCMCAPPQLRLPTKCSLCRRCFLGYVRFRTEIGWISGDFMKSTEMSPATKSNCELQPESERRLHQFQDSLLPSAWASCQWQFHCHECIELEKEMKLEDNPMKATYFQQKSVTTQDSIRFLYGLVFLNAQVPGFDVSPLWPCKTSFTLLPCAQRKVESVVDRTAAYSHMTSEPLTYWSQIFLTDSELMGQPTQIRTKKWERGFGSVASIS